MPLPGILASQISGHLFAPSGAYDSLASVTLSASASSVTFTGVPSGYKHLQIRGIAQSNRATYPDSLQMQLNGDTGANYSNHYLFGNGSSLTAVGYASQNQINTSSTVPSNSYTTSMFGASVIDILDYNNTNKYKTVRLLSGADTNGTAGGGYYPTIGLYSGVWLNTNAITSITLLMGSSSFTQYSSFALYGVK
jgi:hypothetical protein